MSPLYLSTFFARKSSQIRLHIKELSRVFSKKGHTVFFALSSDFPSPEELTDVVHELRNLALSSNGTGRLVGCLSGPVSEVMLPMEMGGGELSCAIGIFDSAQCVPFYSSLPGRKEVQVGRWHSFREKDLKEDKGDLNFFSGTNVNWEDIWNRKHTDSRADMLPKELVSIPTSKAHSLIYMSVPKPDLFAAAISNHFSLSTSCLGLVAAPTHFVTNRPVTLFFDDRIYDDGSVGLALLEGDESRGPEKPEMKTEFVGIRKVGNTMTVSSSEGNVVNALDGLNPTKLLLGAIEQTGLSTPLSDDTFGLAVVSSTGEISRAYKITAGDPSHRGGSISIEAPQAPPDGTLVQFIHWSSVTSLPFPPSLLPSTDPSISFLVVSESAHVHSRTSFGLDSSMLLPNTFFATSSSGFTLSHGALDRPKITRTSLQTNIGPEASWSCTIPGAFAGFRSLETMAVHDKLSDPDEIFY